MIVIRCLELIRSLWDSGTVIHQIRRGDQLICLEMLLLSIIVISSIGFTESTYSPRELRCSVCKVIVQEMEKEISKVSPNKKINLGHRINDQGIVEDKSKPFARSQVHLSEVMDVICDKMDNYVRAKNKITGHLEIIPLITDSGAMNPKFGDYEIIQDSDLNKSLKFYCEGIIEEFDDEINDVLSKVTNNPEEKVCSEATDVCNMDPTDGRSDL